MSNPGERSYLIPVDGSVHSDNSFKWADKNFPKNDRFVIMHGHFQASYMPMPFTPLPSPPLLNVEPKEEKEKLEHWHKIIDKYQKMCQEAKRTCDFVSIPFRNTTDLSRKIIDTAHDCHATAIVMGPRGISGVQRFFLGSTTNAVLSDSDITVAVVKDHTQ